MIRRTALIALACTVAGLAACGDDEPEAGGSPASTAPSEGGDGEGGQEAGDVDAILECFEATDPFQAEIADIGTQIPGGLVATDGEDGPAAFAVEVIEVITSPEEDGDSANQFPILIMESEEQAEEFEGFGGFDSTRHGAVLAFYEFDPSGADLEYIESCLGPAD